MKTKNKIERDDFMCYPILHAGEGPIDMRPNKAEYVVHGMTPQRAASCFAEGLITFHIGLPQIDDSGSDSCDEYVCVEDHTGKRVSYRATVRVVYKVELEEIETPTDAIQK